MVVDTKLYDILEVDPSVDATQLKKAWRKCVLKYHPDKTTGDEDKFKECDAAYKVLSDPEMREYYDRTGKVDIKNSIGGGMDGMEMDNLNDLLNGIFNGFGPFSANHTFRRPKCETLTSVIQVRLEDLFHGKQSKLAIKRKIVCKSCKGKGGQDITVCSTCKGMKVIITRQQQGPMIFQSQQPCPDCKMTGEHISLVCNECKGAKVVDNKKFITVDIKPGTQDRQMYHFEKAGDELPEVEAGDVVIVLQTKPHDVFIRSGNDLETRVSIDLASALVGGRVNVKGLDRNLSINIPKGRVIRPGDILTIEGEGMPTGEGKRGDLLLSFDVQYPSDSWAISVNEEKVRTLLQ